MINTTTHAFPCMGTVVSFHIVHTPSTSDTECDAAVARARGWFTNVEAACNRFDPESELRRLCETTNTAVRVSDLLFEATQFALAVADASGGAFDPTVGVHMEARGFSHDYRSGADTQSQLSVRAGKPGAASYRDVSLKVEEQTITLHQPLLLDLGAIAKGLAIDLAARELHELQGFMIDAGGDLFVGGLNADGQTWRVGIRHPRRHDQLIRAAAVSGCAVCTSGDYERPGTNGAHHLLDARTRRTADTLASVTVIAPSAMVADALATAAFALGPRHGLAFLEQHDVEALLITPKLEHITTSRFPEDVLSPKKTGAEIMMGIQTSEVVVD